MAFSLTKAEAKQKAEIDLSVADNLGNLSESRQ